MNTSNEAVLAGPADFQAVGRSNGVLAGHPAGTRLPSNMIAGVFVICALPFLLNLLGVDFSSPSKPIEVAGIPIPIDAMFMRLNGAFTHTILEWSAFCAALATCILAFSHYRITGNITTPIIGIALFCSGCMDAFHTLAADRLIEAVAENHNLIPFTWAISRVFNALIMLIGVGLFFSRSLEISKSSGRFIILVSVLFGVTAYGIIHYCATSANLPQTMYPDSLITRPWDVAPLILFLFAGLVVYPKFYRSQPSLFAHALVISAIPEVVVELHMAFGSTALFDNHFNIAHFLKIFAYLIPFGGLVLDYVQTYKKVELSNEALTSEIIERKLAQTSLAKANEKVQEAMEEAKKANADLAQLNSSLQHSNADLERSNRELEQFAYVASHDLREPLRKITNYTQLFAKKFVDESDEKAARYIGYITDGATRMDHLIHDLLTFSRASRASIDLEQVDMEETLVNVTSNLEATITETSARISHDPLPTLLASATQMDQVLQNLIGNALKFRSDSRLEIHIGHEQVDGGHRFYVRDNGIGIAPAYIEKIFTIFQRLHSHTEYEGTGIGLSVSRTIVERLGGQIWVESVEGKGSTFYFNVPYQNQGEKS